MSQHERLDRPTSGWRTFLKWTMHCINALCLGVLLTVILWVIYFFVSAVRLLN